MNILEELEELFDLAERDEKFAIKRCIQSIKQVQRIRARAEDRDFDLDELREKYENHVEWVPASDWPEDVQIYHQYVVRGNVLGSGADMPGTVSPIGLDEPEYYLDTDDGLIVEYPITQVEVEDV